MFMGFKDVVILLVGIRECAVYARIAKSNYSGERSFSVLKHVINYLRSTVSQEKVGDLNLLFIENEKLLQLNFDDVI